VTANGIKHLLHLIALDPKGQNKAIDARVPQRLQEGITEQKATRIAISMAIHNDPRLANIDSDLYRQTASFLANFTDVISPANRSLVEYVRKLTGELAAQALHARLMSWLRNVQLDPMGPRTYIEQLRSFNISFARRWGVSPTALRAISDDVDELIKDMFAVEHLNSSKAVQTVALGKFYRKLNQTRAFDADTPAGQAMRGFAAALALAGAAFSLKAAIDDPNGLNVAKAGVDAASAVAESE
jgi:hypothetical protein